jgi:hypothetical protein
VCLDYAPAVLDLGTVRLRRVPSFSAGGSTVYARSSIDPILCTYVERTGESGGVPYLSYGAPLQELIGLLGGSAIAKRPQYSPIQ